MDVIYTGALVGVFASSNGGSDTRFAYVSRWRYQGYAQMISEGVFTPSGLVSIN